MAFEDLFGGGGDGQVANLFGNANNTEPFDFENLFDDPNFIRGLGETGAAISSGEPIGKSVGDFASNITRRRALQKGARASKNNQGSFQERLLEMLGKGDLLSSKDQNDAFDSMTLDGDGNVNLSMKNTPQKQGFARNQPLETMRRPMAGGDDLPNFSNQSSGEAFDFAGLDAEDIGMLLKAEQQFGALSQNEAKMLLDEKARRSRVAIESRRRSEDLARLAEERAESKRRFEIGRKDKIEQKEKDKEFRLNELNITKNNQLELIKERDRLNQIDKATITPDEQARIDAINSDIKVNEKQIEKMDSEIKILDEGKKATPAQQAQIEKNNADLARKETELGLKLDKLEKDEFLSIQPSYVDDKGNEVDVPFEEREANARQANNRGNNKVFYHIQQPVVTEFFDGKADQPGNVVPVFLPKHPKTGVQITSTDIIDTAKANKVSPEEVLRQWGLIR